ncbi:catalase-like [Periplaneta americana]|uniref:catalase-like n=1 Tax=Periplaneta americana TaxID=6978 RepID=UPI0037E73124
MVTWTLRWVLAVLTASVIGVCEPDPVSDQLRNYSKTHTGSQYIKTSYGTAVADVTDSLTVGPRGPMLMDAVYFDTISHFNRERIPDRVVHARGSGAYGYFEVTKDITQYSRAKMFELGKKTKILVRFSSGRLDRGAPDTVRVPMGFAMKLYTKDGIQDVVGYNSPVFFIRDPMRFSSLIHTMERNPASNVEDWTMRWDFFSKNHETVNAIMYLYSHRGIPDGWRWMLGYSQNTFKLVNAKGKAVYARFIFEPTGGAKFLSSETAAKLRGTDPDYSTRDLYNAIAQGNYPSWSFNIQVMTFEQAKKSKFYPFDVTKMWPLADYPPIEVGKFVLNENPTNYFADIEQAAFNPAHMVPGIEPSPDKMLQGRMFAYGETQRHRLCANYMQLPVNCPCRGQHPSVTNYERDGAQLYYSQGGTPTYYPNSFGGPVNSPWGASSVYGVSGYVRRYNTTDDDNYSQATAFWKSLSVDQQKTFVLNILGDMEKVHSKDIKLRTADMFSRVDKYLGLKIAKGMGLMKA